MMGTHRIAKRSVGNRKPAGRRLATVPSGSIDTGLENVHMSRVLGITAAANLCAAMMIAIAPAIGFYIV